MPSTFDRKMLFLNSARDYGREFLSQLEENGMLEEFLELFSSREDLLDVVEYLSDGLRDEAFDKGLDL